MFVCVYLTMCQSSFCYVFFFKQKTAYEMRISDWSSDVCSSDLVDDHAGTAVGQQHGMGAAEAGISACSGHDRNPPVEPRQSAHPASSWFCRQGKMITRIPPMNALEMQLHYPNGDTLPAPGTALELAPGVKRLRMGLP